MLTHNTHATTKRSSNKPRVAEGRRVGPNRRDMDKLRRETGRDKCLSMQACRFPPERGGSSANASAMLPLSQASDGPVRGREQSAVNVNTP